MNFYDIDPNNWATPENPGFGIEFFVMLLAIGIVVFIYGRWKTWH